MALIYSQPKEKIRTGEPMVLPPEELLLALEKWKINITMIADEMGMKRPTLGNKIKGNQNTGFTIEEYHRFINVLRNMVKELEPVLNNYPKLEE